MRFKSRWLRPFSFLAIIFVTFLTISCSIWAVPILSSNPTRDSLTVFLNELSCETDTAAEYKPMLNK